MSPRRKAFGRPSGGIYADLHLHSDQSDGTDPPAVVVQRAAAAGLKAMALTDHDTTAGNETAANTAAKEGITFVPGVEVSAEFERVETHILGLGLERGVGELEERLEAVRHDRTRRVELMIDKLREMDVALTPEDVEAEIGGARSPGRLHVARAMYRIGAVKSVQDAFTRFIGIGRPGYVPKWRMPLAEAIELIHRRGGLAVVAHPGIGGVEKKLSRILTMPFDGVEVWHPEHTVGQCEQFAIIARENGLIPTGGSDDHGSKTERALMGETGLSQSGFLAVEERLKRR